MTRIVKRRAARSGLSKIGLRTAWPPALAGQPGFGLPDVSLVLRAVDRGNPSLDDLIAIEPVLDMQPGGADLARQAA